MNVLLRSFNSTLGERTIAAAASAPTLQALGKKAATIRLANDLFKLYFKVPLLLNNPLCYEHLTNPF